MAEHLEVSELHESSGLEVHVRGPNLLATFLDRLVDVLFLGALVVAQSSNEVVQRFFEPVNLSAPMGPLHTTETMAHMFVILS